VGDRAGELLQAREGINKNGENIKSLIKEYNGVDQKLQLSLAVVREIEHRLTFGIPSAPVKYDLKGVDTRGFMNNLDALKQKIRETGSVEAKQEADEWEKLTGRKIEPGESYRRDEDNYLIGLRDNLVVEPYWGPAGSWGCLVSERMES
jgi:hypothetical protein